MVLVRSAPGVPGSGARLARVRSRDGAPFVRSTTEPSRHLPAKWQAGRRGSPRGGAGRTAEPRAAVSPRSSPRSGRPAREHPEAKRAGVERRIRCSIWSAVQQPLLLVLFVFFVFRVFRELVREPIPIAAVFLVGLAATMLPRLCRRR